MPYSPDENQKLLDKVNAAKRLERLLNDFDQSLSQAVIDHLRSALMLLDVEFRTAFGKTLAARQRRKLLKQTTGFAVSAEDVDDLSEPSKREA